MSEGVDAQVSPIVGETIGQRVDRQRFVERKTPDGFSIYFEPGIHPLPTEQKKVNDLRSAILSGNLQAHSWNSEVAQRIAAYQPEILTIDGRLATHDEEYSEENFLLHSWANLPAEPSKINKSGKLSVVRTEQFAPHALQEAFIGTGIDAKEVEKLFENVMNLDSENMRGFDEFKGNQDIKLYVALVGILGGAGIFASRNTSLIDRRRFLQIAATIAGASAVGVSGFAAIESRVDIDYEKNRRQHFPPEQADAIQKIANAATPDEKNALIAKYDINFNEENQDWVAARNALFSLKTKGAYGRLGVDQSIPSAIIAGSGHIPGMSSILASDEHAGNVLRNYVGGLFKFVDDYFTKALPAGKSHSLTPTQIKSSLINFISLTSIDTIKDPDSKLFKQNPIQAIKDATSFGDVYKENRVQAALAPLLR